MSKTSEDEHRIILTVSELRSLLEIASNESKTREERKTAMRHLFLCKKYREACV